MNEEDKKLLLEMKLNCLEDRGTSRITYNDEKRIKKAKAIDNTLKEIERLNNIIENLTTMTVNGDRTQIKNTAQYKIDKAIEYHDNCVNNLLDIGKIDENEKLAYQVAYEIHNNYLNILKGENNE